VADPGSPADVGGNDAGNAREWRRAAGLFLILALSSSVRPAVLIGVPFALMVTALPVRKPMALLVGAGLIVLALTGVERSGLWYAERGWALLVAGWFAALTLRWPSSAFLSRALASVGGAVAVAAAFFVVRPGAWSVLDWSVAERLRQGVATALAAMTLLRGGGEAMSPSLVGTIYQAAETQAHLFPAVLALVSIAGLGVAWWLYVRMALGARGALSPLPSFRFDDQLVWVFLAGLVALAVGPGEAWLRAGGNVVVFMGALYVLRGAAVVMFINNGLSVLGAVLLAFGMLFLAPVILVGALFIGLGDTWLDIREKVQARAA
jgi:hypothetical protein